MQAHFRSLMAQSSGGVKQEPKVNTLEYNYPTGPSQGKMVTLPNVEGSKKSSKFTPLAGGQLPSVASSGVGAGMLGAMSQLQNTRREVSSPSQWSANGVSSQPKSSNVFADNLMSLGAQSSWPMQNRYVRQQPEMVGPPDPIMNFDRSSPVWQRQYEKTFNEAMQADRQRQIDDANKRVDDRLAGRQGYYATPQQRQSGFFARGMGPMAGDAAIMERQNRPLGDGGPAAAAARADQERRRLEAEQAMEGLTKDGLTRYMPNQDLLSFANALRSQEDRQKSEMLQKAGIGGGTSFRDKMQAMTPDEIRFYRHKLNMATNPAYANRVNQQRADRQEMLDNRREMVRARRAGALEAAGASQQMRNLMAGRGALAGQDGFNALMGLAAMQNANQAFDNYGQAYMANMAPQMLDQRLDAEERMYDKQRDSDRMSEYRNIMTGIMANTQLPPSERKYYMDSANALFGPGSQGGAIGGGGPVELPTSPFMSIPALPEIPGESKSDAYLRHMKHLELYGKHLTPEQKEQYLSERGLVLSDAEREQALRNEGTILNPYKDPIATAGIGLMGPMADNPLTRALFNWALGAAGLDAPTLMEQQKKLEQLKPESP